MMAPPSVIVEPLGNMLVIRPDAPRALQSNLLQVVDCSPKAAIRGVVIAVGPNVRDIQEGQRIIFSALQGYQVDIGEPLVLLQESAVLATE